MSFAKTPYTERPTNEHGVVRIDLEGLIATHAAREGAANIRRNWQKVGIDNVCDAAWLRENIGEFDDDALISLYVDMTSFAGGGDFEEHIDIIFSARSDDWWVS